MCIACDKLVADGLVVVASAGNSGYDDSRGTTTLGSGFQMMSISDPGNADDVIPVGATHRTDPYRYGPISRSARGPTAEGRNKPDLLAPGDRVWACPRARVGTEVGNQPGCTSRQWGRSHAAGALPGAARPTASN